MLLNFSVVLIKLYKRWSFKDFYGTKENHTFKHASYHVNTNGLGLGGEIINRAVTYHNNRWPENEVLFQHLGLFRWAHLVLFGLIRRYEPIPAHKEAKGLLETKVSCPKSWFSCMKSMNHQIVSLCKFLRLPIKWKKTYNKKDEIVFSNSI